MDAHRHRQPPGHRPARRRQKGDGTFTGRIRVGGGWGRYSELIGSGDYDGDRKNDLIAYEPATKTFAGTGVRDTPFDLRRVSTSLFKGGSFNQLG
ncbi:hypothetical protein [Streptomyces sp. P9(2023)]|uniref:hypothetical protein n=1 Tax=Streptomyces sp. P9(2023) TaxID=3064394 RepID=UPI0028F3F67A|nr:hypothetical protein [Streptomyces sp. P9(2023)]